MYICIYVAKNTDNVIMCCASGYYQSANGLMVTHALRHIVYGYMHIMYMYMYIYMYIYP